MEFLTKFGVACTFLLDGFTAYKLENKVKDIIIKALGEAGYEVEIDNGTLIVDDYDTNNPRSHPICHIIPFFFPGIYHSLHHGKFRFQCIIFFLKDRILKLLFNKII